MKTPAKYTRQSAWRERNPWARLVEWARRRCNGKHTRADTRKRYAGVECTITADQAHVRWDEANAGAMSKPTLDRKDSTKGYTFENCRVIEHSLNSRLPHVAKLLDEMLPDGSECCPYDI
jgi:hypothetical protein